MRATCGSQKRTWIGPTSLMSVYNHRKQRMRHINHRETSVKLTLNLKITGRGKLKKKRKVRKAMRLCLGSGAQEDYWSQTHWRTHAPDEMKNSGEADLVPAKEANVKYPQVVVTFCEERLTLPSYPWKDDDKKR